MATHRMSILGAMTLPSTAANTVVFPVPISTQLSLTNPDIGNVLCFVFQDTSADNGLYGSFMVPQNFVGTDKIVVTGIFDGEPGSGDDLGWSIKAKELADDESADAAFGTEDVVQDTDIGPYADEDYFEFSITLSNIAPVVGETIFFFFARDDGSTTYTGNCLVTGLFFEYADA